MSAITEVRVPDIGSFSDVPVMQVLVAAGDRIEVDVPLITLETDKATIDVPASIAGRVQELKIAAGARVSAGTVILTLETEAPASGRIHASPSVRHLARELGVDLEGVLGSGPRGRLLKEDVESLVKSSASQPEQSGLLPWPRVDFSKFGPVERRSLSRTRQISGAQLGRDPARDKFCRGGRHRARGISGAAQCGVRARRH